MKVQLLLPVLAAAVCVACGTGRHTTRPSAPGAPTPASAAPEPSPPSALPAGVASTLRTYSFTQDDLPAGYTVGGTLEVPNDQAAVDYADPQAALKEIQETGRVGGIGQQVLSPPGAPGQIGVSIESFPDAAGAARWAAEPPSLPPSLDPSTTALDKAPGEHASAVHWQQGAKAGYVVSFSRGRIVFGVGISAPAGQESLDVALDLARRLDQKAKSLSS